MIARGIERDSSYVIGWRGPVERPARATVLACKSSSRGMLDILPAAARALVVQHLRQHIAALQISSFLVGRIKCCQLKAPAEPCLIGICVGNRYGVGLTGNVSRGG